MLKTITIPTIIVIVAATVAVWMFMQQPAPAQRRADPPVLLVKAVKAISGRVTLDVSAQGNVQPRTETTLVSEVSGQITEVSDAFVAGGFFKQGELLVRIDPRNYHAELSRAEAAVTAAETAFIREQGLADYAKADYEKLQRSESATDLALRKPQLAEARANLQSANAELVRKRGDLERTEIRAPYDGMIRSKLADLGQFVGGGTQLAQIFAVDYAEIRLPLPDRELPYLDLDSQPLVELTADIGGQRRTWQGSIVRTEGVFDEKSRVLYVVARIPDPYNRTSQRWDYPLRIGTFVDARIAGIVADDIIVLPRNVLKHDNRVWTIAANNQLAPQTVGLLRKDETSVYINQGLNENTLVCLTNLDNPLPGTIVRVMEDEND